MFKGWSAPLHPPHPRVHLEVPNPPPSPATLLRRALLVALLAHATWLVAWYGTIILGPSLGLGGERLTTRAIAWRLVEVVPSLVYYVVARRRLRRASEQDVGHLAGVIAGFALVALVWTLFTLVVVGLWRARDWASALILMDGGAQLYLVRTALRLQRGWASAPRYGGAVGMAIGMAALVLPPSLTDIAQRVEIAAKAPSRRAEMLRTVAATDSAKGAIYQVQLCAAAHAATGAGFPDSLVRLGPAGTGCLDARHTAGEIPGAPGWRLVYAPGVRDGAGTIARYEVRATRPPAGIVPELSYAGDESALVWLVRDESIWTRHYASPAWRVADVAECVDRGRAAGGRLPRTLHEAIADRELCHLSAYDSAAVGDPMSLMTTLDEHRLATYRLTYRPATAGSGFRIEARPLRYGRTGIRSYLLDEKDAMHVTTEDRPAGDRDPLLPPCPPGGTPRPPDCVLGR